MNRTRNTDDSIRLLTLSQAASILKVSRRTLHRMIKKGEIPVTRVGGRWRILESRFEEWVQKEASSPPRKMRARLQLPNNENGDPTATTLD
jgi:excisionase family DNA binding protein